MSDPRGVRKHWEEKYAGRGTAPLAPPSPFVRESLASLPPGRALDLASGDGRHALLLAANGYRVDAIDIAAAGLQRARAVARRRGLDIAVVQADLEEYPLPRERYDVVLNLHYLQRSLWPRIKRALRPGGVVLAETFLVDQARHGHPRNPAFLLSHGELRAAFADFEIVHHEEGLLPSGDGRAHLARLIARKPLRQD
jgi:SAM-dependent methyltransferase